MKMTANFVASVASILYSQFNQPLLLWWSCCLAHGRILPALGSGPSPAASPGPALSQKNGVDSDLWLSCQPLLGGILQLYNLYILTHIASLCVETTVCF